LTKLKVKSGLVQRSRLILIFELKAHEPNQDDSKFTKEESNTKEVKR